MIDPKENKNEELIEALKTEYDDDEVVTTTKTKSVVGIPIKKILIFSIIIIFLLIIVLWLLSVDSSKTSSDYSAYENKMIAAAKNYYKVNNKELPTDGRSNEVTLSQLIKLNYMEDYAKLKSCSGSVTVENHSGDYSYSSYLDCGDNYSSKVLYKQLTESNKIVDKDAGLYRMNNEYVYRGEKVNNYVKFGDKLWRVVKIDSNKDIVLILNGFYDYEHAWDNRYNVDMQYNTGYNDYEKSRMKDLLNDIYEAARTGSTKYNELLLPTTSVKKLKPFKLCIGKVNINNTVTNNAYECQKTLDNTKVGLLTISEYMNASIDPECKNPASKSCQNYNYLSEPTDGWWLATGNANNSYEVYLVTSSGKVEETSAYIYAALRPVIHLGSNTTFSSGKGTQEKPYVIE